MRLTGGPHDSRSAQRERERGALLESTLHPPVTTTDRYELYERRIANGHPGQRRGRRERRRRRSRQPTNLEPGAEAGHAARRPQPAARVAPEAVDVEMQDVLEEPKAKSRPMTAEEKQRALRLFFQGMSDYKIARILGRSDPTINALRCDCARSNAPPRTPRNARPVLHQTSPRIN